MIFGIPTPHVDWFAISAPLSLLAAGGVSLLAAVLLPRNWRRPFGAAVCALGFAAAIVVAASFLVGRATVNTSHRAPAVVPTAPARVSPASPAFDALHSAPQLSLIQPDPADKCRTGRPC